MMSLQVLAVIFHYSVCGESVNGIGADARRGSKIGGVGKEEGKGINYFLQMN